MRMRRKKNLFSRFDKIGDVLIKTTYDEKNANLAVQEKEFLDFQKIFGNDNEIYIEIGCGLGNFAIEFATRNKDKNILAVEVVTNVLLTACEKAEKLNLKNLKFINIGAEYLEKYVQEGAVSGVFLNFSTPFQKNSYANRRLTNRRFLHEYESLLKENAYVYQKTDDLDFFEYSISEYKEEQWTVEKVTYDLYENLPSDNIQTEYERKFVNMGKKICALCAKKGKDNNR